MGLSQERTLFTKVAGPDSPAVPHSWGLSLCLLSPPKLANRGPDSHYARAGPLIQETSGKDPKATYDEIPPAFSQSPGGLKLGAVLRRQRQQGAALQT